MGLKSATTANAQPRIYVACLAAYNNGILHGEWIDAHQEAWAIHEEISRMLRDSPIPDAEEWAIHDFEGFDGVRIAEYAGIEGVAEKAAFIAAHGKFGAELISFFDDIEEARNAMEDRYYGVYSDLAEFMESDSEERLHIPENIRYYINWEAMARDAELNGDVFTIQTTHDQTHVFAEW